MTRPEQVKKARMALKLTHRILEQYVAPAAGYEPWDDPVPDMPYGRAKEVYHLDWHPTGNTTRA